MTRPEDRRLESRRPDNARALVLAPGVEMTCVIADRSASGMRLRLDRNLSLPNAVQVVDIATGVAIEAEVVWRRHQEAGIKQRGQHSLRGLVPSRLTTAKAAWTRAGGR